jgi:hypothetical protein
MYKVLAKVGDEGLWIILTMQRRVATPPTTKLSLHFAHALHYSFGQPPAHA